MRHWKLSSHRRRHVVVGAVFLWFLGLHLLPLLHNINHRLDHTHGFPSHHHERGGEHHHPHAGEGAHAHQHAHHPPDRQTPGNDESEHGRGSLLHYAVALLESHVTTLPEPGPILTPVAPPLPHRAPALVVLAALARGPPSGDI